MPDNTKVTQNYAKIIPKASTFDTNNKQVSKKNKKGKSFPTPSFGPLRAYKNYNSNFFLNNSYALRQMNEIHLEHDIQHPYST